MIILKIRNRLFSLLLSLTCAFLAGIYSNLIEEHLQVWKTSYWVVLAFLCCYSVTQQVMRVFPKIKSKLNRILLYLFYGSTVICSSFFFIYPAIFLLTSKALVEDNRHSICCETPLEYGASEYQNLDMKLSDGITLSGWYIPPTTQKNTVIILIHGHYNDRRGMREWAKTLIQAGYGLYMYDQRGHGQSEGLLDYIYKDLSTDLLEVRQHLLERYPVTSVYSVGVSMGAHAVINAIGRDQTAFQAVWLDGLFPQAPEDLDIFCPHTYVYVTLDRVIQLIFSKPAARPLSLNTIVNENRSVRLMLVSAGDDDMEAGVGRKMSSLDARNTTVWIIPHSKHSAGIFDAPDEYRQRLLDFFNAFSTASQAAE